jgi:hypothetical protein
MKDERVLAWQQGRFAFSGKRWKKCQQWRKASHVFEIAVKAAPSEEPAEANTEQATT